jgi:predicted membrane protein
MKPQMVQVPEQNIRPPQRGSARLKTIVWLFFLVAFIFVCIKVVPVLYSGYLFEDSMKTTARFASVNRQTPDDIRKTLLDEATKVDLPVKPEDIKVTAKDGNVQIEASYSVTVDLQFYQWTLNFHPSVTNNAL